MTTRKKAPDRTQWPQPPRQTLASTGGGGSGSVAWGGITGTISSQTDLQSALNGKAATSHTHAISGVTGLQTALDNKAALAHVHIIGDVTGLQTALDGKQASGSYAPSVHGHTIADVSGLQTALDSKLAATRITVGTTAPVSPSVGDLWVDTN